MSWTTNCHCGAVSVQLARAPDDVAECNCSLCYSHGVLWSYFSPSEVSIQGNTRTYARADSESPTVHLHFCDRCGCVTHWTATAAFVAKVGIADRMGVNMRLFEPAQLSGLTLRFPDGRSWDGQGEWTLMREHSIMP